MSLPKSSDCKRILENCEESYITVKHPGRRYKPDERVVAWALEGRKATARAEVGHIALRAPATDPTIEWKVMLRNGACPLRQFRDASPKKA